jgi:hypothetical protein
MYLLSQGGAEKLVDKCQREGFRRNIDWFIIDETRLLSVFAADPPLAWQDDSVPSDVRSRIVNGKKPIEPDPWSGGVL